MESWGPYDRYKRSSYNPYFLLTGSYFTPKEYFTIIAARVVTSVPKNISKRHEWPSALQRSPLLTYIFFPFRKLLGVGLMWRFCFCWVPLKPPLSGNVHQGTLRLHQNSYDGERPASEPEMKTRVRTENWTVKSWRLRSATISSAHWFIALKRRIARTKDPTAKGCQVFGWPRVTW